MLDIYELLKIDKDKICNFDVLACSIDDYQMQNTLNKNIRKLNAIGDRMLASGDGINVSKKSIEEVIEKVRKSFRSKNSEEWTMSELRIVSYYLMELRITTICILMLFLCLITAGEICISTDLCSM